MEELKPYIYNSEIFRVYLTRKKMKNIRYLLRDDVFYISAPYLASKASIERGLNKFAEKLINARKPKAEGDEFIYLFGTSYPLKESGNIVFNDARMINFSSREDLNKKLRRYFLSFVTSRVRLYEKKMNLAAHNVRVRKMKTRYGSNSKATNTVSFSLTLLHYSVDIIDSVVVHELSHSVHFDHSAKFYAVVYKYCPNYNELHHKLNKGIFL